MNNSAHARLSHSSDQTEGFTILARLIARQILTNSSDSHSHVDTVDKNDELKSEKAANSLKKNRRHKK
jgi:hypothetical protein